MLRRAAILSVLTLAVAKPGPQHLPYALNPYLYQQAQARQSNTNVGNILNGLGQLTQILGLAQVAQPPQVQRPKKEIPTSSSSSSSSSTTAAASSAANNILPSPLTTPLQQSTPGFTTFNFPLQGGLTSKDFINGVRNVAGILALNQLGQQFPQQQQQLLQQQQQQQLQQQQLQQQQQVQQQQAIPPQDPIITIDLCFFVGEDIHQSFVRCNKDLNPSAPNFIPDSRIIDNYFWKLTNEANKALNIIDENAATKNNDFLLRYNGFYHRSDYLTSRYPENITNDILSLDDYNRFNKFRTCDLNVFMVYNRYFSCEPDPQNNNVDFSDTKILAKGAPCESHVGSGYLKILDVKGVREEDDWLGPQILAHHVLLAITRDTYDSRYTQNDQVCRSPTPNPANEYCKEWYSLLHPDIYPFEQYRDACVVDKLNKACTLRRSCLRFNN